MKWLMWRKSAAARLKEANQSWLAEMTCTFTAASSEAWPGQYLENSA